MSIENISKSPVKFDMRQLNFLNRKALKARWKAAQSSKEEMEYFVSNMR